MYLNRIPYGNQAIGIQTAAELYFHVPASQLDLAQSAMLAGLPQAPSAYDPDLNPGRAKQRQDAVLQAMVTVGSITQAQANAAAAEKLTYYTWEQYLPPTIINGANTTSFLNYLTAYYLPELFHGDTLLGPGRLRHLHHPQPERPGDRRRDRAQRDHRQPGVVRAGQRRR